MIYLIRAINLIVLLLTALIIVKVFLSYFMDPYHPVRSFVDRIVNPLLRPLQRMIPPIGGLDISPIVLLIIIQVLGNILIRVMSSLIN
ncbi:MAG: YggT family protein [Anaerolineales bacterium]|nr:YggT family protein [Anaerolineae bacterium]PWB50853.1 MAG: YggT family protein [Anaerolineales bacterium]